MIFIDEETVKLLLGILEENHYLIKEYERPESLAHYDRAITAIRKALEDKQEPIRGWWLHTNSDKSTNDVSNFQLTNSDKARGWTETHIYAPKDSK